MLGVLVTTGSSLLLSFIIVQSYEIYKGIVGTLLIRENLSVEGAHCSINMSDIWICFKDPKSFKK